MVSRFRRTVSFPKPIITTRPSSLEKCYHVRSVSLPCRSHPLLSQVNDEIHDLQAWQSLSDDRNSTWLCEGSIRLRNLHDSFDDLLQLPETQESLRRRSDWVDKLLEEFLRFVDVYGILRGSLVALKEEQTSAQVAVRRRDEVTIVSFIKNRKKLSKEMMQLVSTVRAIGRCSIMPDSLLTFDEDAELAGVLRDVNEVTVSVTVSMLNAVSGSSSMKCKSCIGIKLLNKKVKGSYKEEGIQEFQQVEDEKFGSLRKKGEQELRSFCKKLRELENCVVDLERQSGEMFRSLVKTRVSLLNILTQ